MALGHCTRGASSPRRVRVSELGQMPTCSSSRTGTHCWTWCSRSERSRSRGACWCRGTCRSHPKAWPFRRLGYQHTWWKEWWMLQTDQRTFHCSRVRDGFQEPCTILFRAESSVFRFIFCHTAERKIRNLPVWVGNFDQRAGSLVSDHGEHIPVCTWLGLPRPFIWKSIWQLFLKIFRSRRSCQRALHYRRVPRRCRWFLWFFRYVFEELLSPKRRRYG